MVLGINLSSYFLAPTWLYALASLIPLILLYLIRPKPKQQEIPSLMFFLKNQGADRQKNFLKYFSKDWLFWIQLLVLILLSLAAAKPYVNVPEESLAQHSIIVLDASASMQTAADGKTRFDQAIDRALDELSSVNTIILAKNNPLIVKQEVDRGEARDFLQDLEPSATSTAIYDAARAALEYAGDDTHVVVLSDFIETEVDNDINTAKRALEAKGAIVDLVPYTGSAQNVGITDVVVNDQSTSIQVRNYFKTPQDVTVTIGQTSETLNLDPGSADVVTFSTPRGITTAELDTDDALSVDNTAFISTPETTTLDILFITNDEQIEQSNLWVAMQAISDRSAYTLNIEKAVPPRSININHDIVILKDFDQQKILPGVFRDLEEAVRQGTSLIITPQRGMFNFNPLQSLLPVQYVAEKTTTADITAATQGSLTRDVQFGTVEYYFQTTANDGVQSIAKTKNDNGTIIGYEPLGAGSIIYYGIFDQNLQVDGETRQSTFKNNLYYPIFWKRSLDLLTNTPSVKTLNRRTGTVYNLPQGQEAETPEGDTVTGSFLLDRQGIYSFQTQDIAANLLNAEESDVSGEFSDATTSNVEEETVTTEEPKPLTSYAIILGIIALFGELFYTKLRGDM
jgi:hypothetical protein